jgi:hypothetical protein
MDHDELPAIFRGGYLKELPGLSDRSAAPREAAPAPPDRVPVGPAR